MTYTHEARFYGIPAYFDENTGTLAGKNFVFDWLILLAGWFHNAVVERGAQFAAAMLDRPYEPGFPLKIKEIV